MFRINWSYSKKDIYSLLKVPKAAQRGAWDTGYHEYNDAFYVFANIGIPGRTGHDYNNRWQDGDLIWYSKTNGKTTQPFLKKLLNPTSTVHIFTRQKTRDNFTYAGMGKVKKVSGAAPVEVIWSFEEQAIIDLQQTWLSALASKFDTDLALSEAQNDDERAVINLLLRIRKGQAKLRKSLFRLYKGKCCISGFHIKDALNACHIDPHSESGNNNSTNALLLRSDIHDLFDAGLIGIHPETLKIVVHPSLLQTEYGRFDGQPLSARTDELEPDQNLLKKRWLLFRKD